MRSSRGRVSDRFFFSLKGVDINDDALAAFTQQVWE